MLIVPGSNEIGCTDPSLMLWLLILNPLLVLLVFIRQHPLTIAGLSLLWAESGDLWLVCHLTCKL